MCVENGILPKDISECEMHISELQRKLVRTDQSIVGYRLFEDNDYSRTAKVIASSECSFEIVNTEHFRYLDLSYGLILPIEGRLDNVSLYMEADTEENATVDFYLSDGIPQNYRVKKLYKSLNVMVNKKGWYEFDLGIKSCPGNKLFVMVRKNNNLRIYMSKQRLTGSLGIYAKEDKLEWNTVYETINNGGYIPLTPCFKVEPPQSHYSVDKINNGYIRPYGLPNLWISSPIKPHKPEWVMLDFGCERDISQVDIVFNSDTNHNRLYNSINTVNPELVKDYEVVAVTNDGEKIIATKNENFVRFVTHKFEPIKATGIKLYIYSTNGGSRAEVFDLRVYK
jgi:hypothetical protein